MRIFGLTLLVLLLGSCGDKEPDPNTGTATADSSGGSGGGSGSSTGASGGSTGAGSSSGGASSGGSSGADLCPDGTCVLVDGGPCEEPTGPVGNGCCACGPDDRCSAFCRCAAPDTPIGTPTGERAIASLRPGDLVYSVEDGAVIEVPVLEVSKLPAPREHTVVRLQFADGRAIEMSPGHPTAHGRTFGELAVGELLGESRIVQVSRVGYAHAYTHDILPGSASGAYFAAGALVGSTLHRGAPERVCE